MGLLKDFKAFIAKENLFQAKDHLLLAVSGGVDSVVLCELCKQGGYTFSIAHCNFQLRGEESARDENFVRDLAQHYNVPFYLRHFDTEAYARENKGSIQVAARELRYRWFSELLREHQLQRIVTGHHANDNIETVLMNLFKGTGVAGMRGMLPLQGKITRPLLFASRENLLQFAQENNLRWVEDSSNAANKYARNFLRNKLMPLITELYPQAQSSIINSIQHFREGEMLFDEAFKKLMKKTVVQKGSELHIPILKLQKSGSARSILYELLYPLGFTSKQTKNAERLMHSETGKYIASATHRIFRNRNWLIIAPNDTSVAENILIEEGQQRIQFALGSLQLNHQTILTPQPSNPPASNIALLDATNIKYPLILRKWKPGDYFYPLGMRKKKKLARFLIDNKLSATEKEMTWVIETDKKILWVIGHRIDDRFKVTPDLKQVLRIELT